MTCEDLLHLSDDRGGSLALDLHHLLILAIVVNHQEIVCALICEDIGSAMQAQVWGVVSTAPWDVHSSG